MPSGAEITVLDLGYAVEMLAFQVHHAYVLADLETRLPAWLKRRIGQILVGRDVVIEEVGTDDVTTAASLVKERRGVDSASCGIPPRTKTPKDDDTIEFYK